MTEWVMGGWLDEWVNEWMREGVNEGGSEWGRGREGGSEWGSERGREGMREGGRERAREGGNECESDWGRVRIYLCVRMYVCVSGWLESYTIFLHFFVIFVLFCITAISKRPSYWHSLLTHYSPLISYRRSKTVMSFCHGVLWSIWSVMRCMVAGTNSVLAQY